MLLLLDHHQTSQDLLPVLRAYCIRLINLEITALFSMYGKQRDLPKLFFLYLYSIQVLHSSPILKLYYSVFISVVFPWRSLFPFLHLRIFLNFYLEICYIRNTVVRVDFSPLHSFHSFSPLSLTTDRKWSLIRQNKGRKFY